MSVFDILTMIGGLALFLYGMEVMGNGLSKASGGRMERILEKMTDNIFKAVLLGAGVTAVIQSSSATTVMVVGFVNSGIMKLSQAVGVIMGANIGTTVTSWLLSLTGIQGDNFILTLMKPSSFSPILAVIGIGFLMFSKNEKKKDIGTIMIGFTVLMFGMETMSDAVKPLADVPEFANILLMFKNPLLGMLAGLVLTAVIQSSSVIGIGWYSAVFMCDRGRQLWCSYSYYYGTEHRYMCDGTAVQYRCIQECKAYSICPFVFQYYRYDDFYDWFLCAECICPFQFYRQYGQSGRYCGHPQCV